MYVMTADRHDDVIRALEASHEKRFFGSKVTVSIHDGVGKIMASLSARGQTGSLGQ